MGRNRLEAFSDGVIAIIITIMVLELKVPHGDDLQALQPLLPIFLSYALSFMYVGIYWNNHHHLLHTCHKVTGGILWANLNLLFWLSLFPFATAWMGENHLALIPSAAYGIVLLLAALAFYIMQHTIIATQGAESLLKQAVGKDCKGKASLILYVFGVGLAFYASWLAQLVYFLVACLWLVPDRRIEKALSSLGV